MANFICIAQNDWADEFTASSYRIYENTTKEAVVENVAKIIQEGSSFGTNESWEENELDFADFRIEEITDTEVEIIKRILGEAFGTGVF